MVRAEKRFDSQLVAGTKGSPSLGFRSGSFLVICGVLAILFSSCGSGSTPQPVPFEVVLESDEICVGARLAIHGESRGVFGGSFLDEIACDPDADLLEIGCNVEFENGPDAISIRLTGCDLEAGERILQCVGPPDVVAELEAKITVACGCGCRETCPTETRGCVAANASDTRCTEDVGGPTRTRFQRDGPPTVRRRVVSLPSTTSTTTSSTEGLFYDVCCESYRLALHDSERVSEVKFVNLSHTSVRPQDLECYDGLFAFAPGSVATFFRRELASACLLVPEDATGSRFIAECDGPTGGYPYYDVTAVDVIYALDRNFEPIDVDLID